MGIISRDKSSVESINNIKYKELVKIFKTQRKQQFFLLLLCSLEIGCNLYFVYQLQGFVDYIIAREPVSVLINEFIFIILLGIFSLILGIWENKKWHIFRYNIINEMRMYLYQRILKKKASFFDERTTGDVVSAIMSDGSTIAESAGISVLMLLLNLLKIGIIFVVLLMNNIVMGSIVVIFSAIYFLFINYINRKMRSNYRELSQETANINQHVTQDVQAVSEIKILNQNKFFEKKYATHLKQDYMKKAKKVITIDVTNSAINSFIVVIFPVCMVLIGGIYLYQNMISVGMVLLFYTYTQNLVEPLNNLADFYRGTQMAVGAAERIYEYTQEDEEKTTDLSVSEKIELQIDIKTHYWKDKKVLCNIHEIYHGGDCVFVSGESGAGKSTLLKLICGLYPVTDGKISICGTPINEVAEQSLYDVIKMQFQEPIILEGSLRENIELGEIYSDAQIYDVIKNARLVEFSKDYGLDYVISERGKNLSGGQKQRIALARLLIRKPKILILDEATSGIDQENENEIIKSIRTYVEQEKCILFVTSHGKNMKELCNKELQL